MKSHGTTIALTLFLAAISMGNVTWGAEERDFEPSFGHREECTPVRTVTGLRQQVRWWARDGAPVALGAQISDGSDAPASSVAWRLVVTTFDREVVDERHGVSPLREGNGFATVTFD
ncbi:MAG TPA: hypothetical protein VGR00_12595, partial [Thermoanaerobaculia bacterium]|nr:hypothetical protein [Thermoanaerobaculia bacterium]